MKRDRHQSTVVVEEVKNPGHQKTVKTKPTEHPQQVIPVECTQAIEFYNTNYPANIDTMMVQFCKDQLSEHQISVQQSIIQRQLNTLKNHIDKFDPKSNEGKYLARYIKHYSEMLDLTAYLLFIKELKAYSFGENIIDDVKQYLENMSTWLNYFNFHGFALVSLCNFLLKPEQKESIVNQMNFHTQALHIQQKLLKKTEDKLNYETWELHSAVSKLVDDARNLTASLASNILGFKFSNNENELHHVQTLMKNIDYLLDLDLIDEALDEYYKLPYHMDGPPSAEESQMLEKGVNFSLVVIDKSKSVELSLNALLHILEDKSVSKDTYLQETLTELQNTNQCVLNKAVGCKSSLEEAINKTTAYVP